MDIKKIQKGSIPKNLRVSLCSISPENPHEPLTRKRFEGPFPYVANTAILSICMHMERCGYSKEYYQYYDTEMLVPNDDEIRKYYASYRPQIVGMSCPLSTGYSQLKRISAIIREVLPSTLIVSGGNITGASDTIVKCTDVDMTVIGDGEKAWAALLDCLTEKQLIIGPRNIDESKLNRIKGLYFYDKSKILHYKGFGEKIQGADIPFPDYDWYNNALLDRKDEVRNYFRDSTPHRMEVFYMDHRALKKDKRKMIASLFTSKGCAASCTFCQRTSKGYRVLDLDKLDQHLNFIKNTFDVGFIKILDESFGLSKKHAYEVAKLMKKHDMLWFAVGRCDSFSYDDVKFYKQCGMTGLQFGVESGSQKILNIMEKRYKLDEIREALLICAKLQINSPIPIVLGMPGETEDTVKDTGRFIGTIAADLGVHPEKMSLQFHYVLPLPGTPLYEYGEYVGVIGKGPIEVNDYLERISGASIYKRYYINLNGAPISEVIFWEYLFRLEASRTFRKKSKLVAPAISLDNPLIMHKLEAVNNPHEKLRFKRITFTFITRLIENYLIGNVWVDTLPRWIVYPLVKRLGYFEYCLQRLFRSNYRHAIFQQVAKVPRLAEKGRSLRDIVYSNEGFSPKGGKNKRDCYIV